MRTMAGPGWQVFRLWTGRCSRMQRNPVVFAYFWPLSLTFLLSSCFTIRQALVGPLLPCHFLLETNHISTKITPRADDPEHFPKGNNIYSAQLTPGDTVAGRNPAPVETSKESCKSWDIHHINHINCSINSIPTNQREILPCEPHRVFPVSLPIEAQNTRTNLTWGGESHPKISPSVGHPASPGAKHQTWRRASNLEKFRSKIFETGRLDMDSQCTGIFIEVMVV